MNIKHYLHLHVIIIILGFTAILGKLISTDAISLVWHRTLFAAISSFLLFYFFTKEKFYISSKDFTKLLIIGFIVGLHWILFFHSIKVSNVSICLATLPVSTLFTALAEPIINKKKISLSEIILSLVIIIGINIIFHSETRYLNGILYGIASFILAGLFTVLNKKHTKHLNPILVNAIEMTAAFIGISFFILISNYSFQKIRTYSDVIYLLILSIVCTTYAFSAVVYLLKKLSAYYVVLSLNLEPIYGIILALIIFGENEKLSTEFYFGSLLIFLSIILYPIIKKPKQN